MYSAMIGAVILARVVNESAKKSGVECQRRGKSATVPFNRLILRGILRAVRPRAADTGPPTFWRSRTRLQRLDYRVLLKVVNTTPPTTMHEVGVRAAS